MALFNFNRSFEKLSEAVSRLVTLRGLKTFPITSQFEIISKYILVDLKEFASRRDLQVAGRPLFGPVEIKKNGEIEDRVKVFGKPSDVLPKWKERMDELKDFAAEMGFAFLPQSEKICRWELKGGDLRPVAAAMRGTELPGPFLVEDCEWAFFAIEVLVAERLSLICDEGADVLALQKKREPIHFKEPSLHKNILFAFGGILTESEIREKMEEDLKKKVKQWEIEATLMADFLGERGKEIRLRLSQMEEFGFEAKAKVYQEIIHPYMREFL